MRRKSKVQSPKFSVLSFQFSVKNAPVTEKNKIRVAVLGVGSLGKEHARIYSELEKSGQGRLAGIFDANVETAKRIAIKHGAHVFTSIAEAAANSDALNVVTPTNTHFEIAKALLAQGKHVL